MQKLDKCRRNRKPTPTSAPRKETMREAPRYTSSVILGEVDFKRLTRHGKREACAICLSVDDIDVSTQLTKF